MSDISLKPATVADAQVLFDLLDGLAEELGKKTAFRGSVESLAQHGFGTPPAFEAIIAWRGAEAVGLILYFYEFSTWRTTPGVYVQDFYIRPDARGAGLGKRLTAAAVAAGKKRGATYMRLAVHEGNSSGMGFYLSHGFAAVDDETAMLLDGPQFDEMADQTG